MIFSVNNKSREFACANSLKRVDEIDTLIRRTKMDAYEEARSRQYKGTTMSGDEVSKVYKTLAFGIYDKSYINEKNS